MKTLTIAFLFVISSFCGFAAAKVKPLPKPRIFVDTVYKIKLEGEKSAITFRRAAAIYLVKNSDKQMLQKLSMSQKNKKAVQVTADTNNHQIINVK